MVHARRDAMLKKVVEMRRLVLGYATGITGSLNLAEDVFQEAVVVVCNKADEFQPDSNLRAWVLEIARRTALDMIRKAKRDRPALSVEALDALARDERVGTETREPDARLRALQRCLEELSERARQMLQRRYAENLSCQRIAQEEKRPLGSIYVSLTRIRARLRACILGRLDQGANA